MKRRTKQNIGNGEWPNMRPDTLKQISGELIRARKKHPLSSPNNYLCGSYARQLKEAFDDYDNGKSSATQIYAVAATVAAMAIRCMEEGTRGSKYCGNTQASDQPLRLKCEDRQCSKYRNMNGGCELCGEPCL